MFMQVKQLPYLWKNSKYDFVRHNFNFLRNFKVIFVVSFLATISGDVHTGLGIALVFTMFTVVLREQW